MTIKTKLFSILITIIILMIGAIASQNIAQQKNDGQIQDSSTRYLSYLLADEFRQTSMDLTRLGRTYVATGEQEYWDAYWNIVKWRNGELARPDYVDDALYKGMRKKQSDIMKELNFSAKEFAFLKEAGDNSNALIKTETQAMESIRQGIIVDGPFQPLPGESVHNFAIRIVFDVNYHNEVSKIMMPVAKFFNALDQRTAGKLKESQEDASSWLTLSLSTQIITAVLTSILFILLVKALFNPLQQAINAMYNIGEGDGDLSKRLSEHGKDELSALGRGFNLFASNIQNIVIELRTAIEDISHSSSLVNSTANDTERAVFEQKNSIEQLCIAIEQMVPAVKDIAESAITGVELASESDKVASDGLKVVEQAINNISLLETDIDSASDVIEKLESDVDNIGTVLDVIRGIADQTNLLALNAAIEAARAGEQGRGFAVVADEVRTLAQRTQDSTSEIQQMIEKLQAGAKDAVQVMGQSKARTVSCVANTRETGESLGLIISSVSSITDITNQIAAATEEQNATIGEIKRNVDNIDKHVENTATGSQETAQNSESTNQMTQQIKVLIEQFQTS
jgi:methyl-accepting chemotaxis protein